MTFLVTGYDYTDAQALERRLAVREAHMTNIVKLKAEGKILFAAAKVNEADQMCGSFVFMEVASREEVEAYLEKEVYVSGKVWERVEVEEVKVPDLFR